MPGLLPPSESPRRRFLAQLAAAAAAAVALSPMGVGAQTLMPGAPSPDHDEWMKPLKGKHRQIFHGFALDSAALLMAKNFLDSYRNDFGAKDEHVNAVVGVHGPALSIGFTDAIWSKYTIGKVSNVNDPVTKEPAARNIFGSGGEITVTELQKRGIVLLMCNTALKLRAKAMAASLGVEYDAMYAELNSSRLPGTILVPSLVVALNRAQESGFTYVRAS